jgi:hypothetical protein
MPPRVPLLGELQALAVALEPCTGSTMVAGCTCSPRGSLGQMQRAQTAIGPPG